jgi:hypothetical protein
VREVARGSVAGSRRTEPHGRDTQDRAAWVGCLGPCGIEPCGQGVHGLARERAERGSIDLVDRWV